MIIGDSQSLPIEYFSIPSQYRVRTQIPAGGRNPATPSLALHQPLIAHRAPAFLQPPPPPPPQPFVASVLLPHGLVFDRVEKMATDIREDFPETTPHLLVVLKGGSEFAVDLTRTLRKLHTYREGKHLPFTVDYVRVKSYEGTESTGTGAFGVLWDGGRGWKGHNLDVLTLTSHAVPGIPLPPTPRLPSIRSQDLRH
jgi:hypothetical protein